jgi:hypothetical protein
MFTFNQGQQPKKEN